MTRSSAVYLLMAACFPAIVVWWLVPGAVTHVLSSRGLLPHGHCYLWQPQLVGLHVVSDLLIGIAYFVISITLAYLVYRAREHIPFHWMFLAFGAFIIACGMTHLMEVWTLWHPVYWLSGDVKMITAIASVGTAIALPPLVPRVLGLIEAQRVAEARKIELLEQAALLAREQEARNKAEGADRAKDQFLAMVSHELRNPLSPILAWSRLLQQGEVPAEKQQIALDAIERNAMAQARLVDDLLDVSRIVSGKLRLDLRPTALGAVIEAAMEAVRPAAETKGVHLQITLDPAAGVVLADPDRLRQVVWNLVSNGIKFTPRHGRVHVALERVDSHLEFSVDDTGAGIAPDALPHVFEHFWQENAGSDRARGGLGLGLAIVRHLVEAHGGEIDVSSAGVGLGSRFTVKLPLLATTAHPIDPQRRHLAVAADGAPSRSSDLQGISVLVVDDEPDSNEALQTLLGSRGAEVRVAGSARQALEILDGWRPDLVVSDIGMPGEDGYALLQQIRARPAARGGNVPAIALTAYARVDDRIRILRAGFRMHLVKPIDPGELIAVVAAVARTA
jgi:signal transduction histidine kinase/CheY-like chemotaxis protein